MLDPTKCVLINITEQPKKLLPGTLMDIAVHSVSVEEVVDEDLKYKVYSFYDADDRKLHGISFSKLIPIIYVTHFYADDTYHAINAIKVKLHEQGVLTTAFKKMHERYPSMTSGDLQTAKIAMDFILAEMRERFLQMLG